MFYHRYVLFFQGRRMAAEVKGGRTVVATDEVTAFPASVAAVVVVPFP